MKLVGLMNMGELATHRASTLFVATTLYHFNHVTTIGAHEIVDMALGTKASWDLLGQMYCAHGPPVGSAHRIVWMRCGVHADFLSLQMAQFSRSKRPERVRHVEFGAVVPLVFYYRFDNSTCKA